MSTIKKTIYIEIKANNLIAEFFTLIGFNMNPELKQKKDNKTNRNKGLCIPNAFANATVNIPVRDMRINFFIICTGKKI